MGFTTNAAANGFYKQCKIGKSKYLPRKMKKRGWLKKKKKKIIKKKKRRRRRRRRKKEKNH